MSDLRVQWLSGQAETIVNDFWQPTLSRQDPEIPNLPLEDEIPRSAPVFRIPLRVPVFKKRLLQDTNPAHNVLLSTLAIAQAPPPPFRPSPGSQPVLRARLQVSFLPPNLLISTLAPLAASALPPGQGDSEQVRPVRRAQDTLLPPNLLLSTLLPPPEPLPGDIVFRMPLRAPVFRRKAAQDTNPQPNLLLSTLASVAAPAAPPFRWAEVPQPSRRRSSQAPTVNVVYEAEFTPMPVGRGLVSDPVRRVRAVQATLPLNPNIFTAQVAPPPAPFEPVDLPQPARGRRGQLPLSLNLLSTTLAPPAEPPATLPFRWADVPQPSRRRSAQAPQVTVVYAAVDEALPPGQQLYSDRVLSPRRRVPDLFLSNPLFSTVLEQIPPGEQHYPAGVSPPRRRVPDVFQSLLETTLAIVYDPWPARDLDFRVTRRRQRTPDSYWPGINSLIPNERPPVPPPAEQPQACKLEVRLAPSVLSVRLQPSVFTIRLCTRCGGKGGCMTCKSTDQFSVPEVVKNPATDQRVYLDFYRDVVSFRRSNEQYSAGEFMRPAIGNGYAYEALSAGTTGERMPPLPTTIGEQVQDGSVTWVCRAADLNAVNAISAPSAAATPSGELTITNVAVLEGWKIVGTLVGGVLGRDYVVAWSFTLGGSPVTVTGRVKVRRT